MSISLAPVTRLVTPHRPGALRYLPTLALGMDILLATFAIGAASAGRENLHIPGQVDDFTLDPTLSVFGPLMLIGWIALIAWRGGYRPEIFGAGTDEYKLLLHATLITAALIGIGCYLARFQLSRGFFVLAIVMGAPLLMLGRFLLRRSVQQARARGALFHRVLIAGAEGHVDEIASVLDRETWLGYDVVGAVTPDLGGRVCTGLGLARLGSTDQIAHVAREINADIVFLAGGACDSSTQVRQIAWDLEHADIRVVVAPSVTDVSAERVRIRPVGGLPLIHLDKPRATDAARWGKRAFDVAGSLALLVAFSPVFALAAARIWLYDRGPVLFKQTRVGRDGAAFACWKFRSMVTNAEDLLAELHAKSGYTGGLFKMEHDPRITAPGHWLRRYSLDELPQLVNVLRGEMSLVGPRPPLEHEVAQYDTAMHRRLRVRPGMTGLWQVSGRSDLSWSEAIRLDLYYVDNWSMIQDLTILLRTFKAVFGSRGAY